MSSSRAPLAQECLNCGIRRTSHTPGNKGCIICNVCFMSMGGYCAFCDSKQIEDGNRNRLNQGVNNSLADERKIQAARRPALSTDAYFDRAIQASMFEAAASEKAAKKAAADKKRAQETADHELAHQLAMLDMQIADQSSSSFRSSTSSQASLPVSSQTIRPVSSQTTHPVSSQTIRPVSSQTTRPVSSQTTRPTSSQAPPKSLSTRGMFDRATHRRVSGNGACFFTSIWQLLYGSSGMTSRDGVLQISTEQLLCLKQEVLDYLRGLELSKNQFDHIALAQILESVAQPTLAKYADALWALSYQGGFPEMFILVDKLRRREQIAVALVNMDNTAPDLSPVCHSPNCGGPDYKLGVLLFSGAHYELLLNPNSPKGTFDVTYSYVMNELKSDVPELRRIATRLKRGGK